MLYEFLEDTCIESNWEFKFYIRTQKQLKIKNGSCSIKEITNAVTQLQEETVCGGDFT